MSQRFFCDRISETGGAVLDGSEAHHLAHVMRAAAGDLVVLFDGSGREFVATVRRVSKSRVELDVAPGKSVDRELPFPLILGVALPKGERQKWLVEKAVELGVSRLVPFKTQRGVADPGSALSRLRRAVIESSKQCGRNRLMEIADVAGVESFFRELPVDAVRLIGQPGNAAISAVSLLTAFQGKTNARCFAIGPEGGFTDAEFAAAVEAGWQPITLGASILRVETAALALAAVAGAIR
jgi:16S rRNA (uracil1498-N3)-methyltransferase